MIVRSRRNQRNRHRARAFSLAETSVSILIVGTMFVAAVNTVGATAIGEFKLSQQEEAIYLAEQLMSEILQLPYTDPEDPDSTGGKETGEDTGTRSAFDDVDDYSNWSGTAQDKSGTTIAGTEDYSLNVATKWVNPMTSADAIVETGVRLIEVTVEIDGKEAVTLTAFRTNAVSDPVAVNETRFK